MTLTATNAIAAPKRKTNGAHNGKAPGRGGLVEVHASGVYVDATFDHPEVVAYAQEHGLGLDPVGTLQMLLVAGIMASHHAGAAILAEEARQATDGLRALLGVEAEQQIRGALKRALGENGEDGALIPEVERIVTAAAKLVEDQAGLLLRELKGAGEDAVPQLIEKRVRRATEEVVGAIIKNALAGDGALGTHLRNHSAAIKDLRGDLSNLHDLLLHAKVAAEHIDPATAGRDWQPSVLAEVARFSLITGDRLEETGDQPGAGRSKKGDGVLHVAGSGSEARVAIECRTGKQRLTLADLQKAKDNRAAGAALLLVEQRSALPKDAEELGFRAYADERVVVLHHDPANTERGVFLATALQVSRLLAQLAASTTSSELPREVLLASLARLEHSLGRLKPLRTSATGIETEIGRIRGYAQDIERDLRGTLGELGGIAA